MSFGQCLFVLNVRRLETVEQHRGCVGVWRSFFVAHIKIKGKSKIGRVLISYKSIHHYRVK